MSLEERDRLSGWPGTTHRRGAVSEHVSPDLLGILDRLDDTPAEIAAGLDEPLRQTPPGVTLTDDLTSCSGRDRGSPGVGPPVVAAPPDRQRTLPVGLSLAGDGPGKWRPRPLTERARPRHAGHWR